MSVTHSGFTKGFALAVVIGCLWLVPCQQIAAQSAKEKVSEKPSEKASGDAGSSPLTILAWNIEIGGSEVETILSQLKTLAPYDVLALSEVPRKSADKFVATWGREASFIGTKGGEACLLVTWNTDKFEQVTTQELMQFNGQEFAPGIQVAPLIVKLRHKASKTEFTVVMNHLARGSAELRKRQATILVDWAKQQSDPVIAVGGYNFDYDIPTKKGNEAFDVFMKEGVWKWVEPKQMVDTNWSDRNNDGKDEYPDSMLDFVFAAGPARDWKIESEILVRDGDFPDNEQTSDQRPLRTIVVFPKRGD